MPKQTNTEMLTELMEFSPLGGLIQCYVIDALKQHSEYVLTADLSGWDNNFVSPEAWRKCAEETKKTIDKHLNL
jgi:hypothetical protein